MVELDICVCTFQRAHIAVTLSGLLAQTVPTGMRVRIIVVDNDDSPSAKVTVTSAAADQGLEVIYLHVPGRNISIARNACLEAADADWLAFVDDDEVIPPGWLTRLWARAVATDADALFGPVISEFPDDAPDWMRALDLHSPLPHRVNGSVLTGASNNTLLRWRGTPWTDQRFDLARGRSGGEDTEFFNRLRRMGARLELAEDARVFEPVPASRLSLSWLRARRFRAGQSHVTAAGGRAGRYLIAAKAAAKCAFSAMMILPNALNPTKWRFWYLRMVFHAGVIAGSLSLPQRESYG